MSNNWSRFTKQAQEVMRTAQNVAVAQQQEIIRPEHLLLAFLQYKDCDTYQLLQFLNIDMVTVSQQVKAQLKLYGAEQTLKSGLSEEFKKILEQAAIASRWENIAYITSRHLLLGLLKTPSTLASQLLLQQGITIKMVQERSVFVEEASEEAPPAKKPYVEKHPYRISLVFVGFIVTAVAAGYASYEGFFANSFPLFLFVTASWIVSVSLHEFGHALTAYRFGDYEVAQRGYLTLNPLRYAQGSMSFVYPILIMVIGGIGLPGAAVLINDHMIPGKIKKSLVSAAGPIATFIFAALLAIPFAVESFNQRISLEHSEFWAGLSMLIFLEITVGFLNLLPIPGLDGYHILEPFLPEALREILEPVKRYAFFLLVFLFVFDTPVRDWFWYVVFGVLEFIQVERFWIDFGLALFRFWEV